MEKRTCDKCNENMKLIDKYSQFLEPDEMRRFTNQEKTENVISRMEHSLNIPKVNIEIYKCDKCGEYKGVEYI
jgi:predicted RNA-binding Zn-ribbon protein involved in translation (DUF1610 family)